MSTISYNLSLNVPMQLLEEIFRTEGVPTQGRIVFRETFVLELPKAQPPVKMT